MRRSVARWVQQGGGAAPSFQTHAMLRCAVCDVHLPHCGCATPASFCSCCTQAVLKVYCVPIAKRVGGKTPNCSPLTVFKNMQLFQALEAISEDCGLDDIIPKVGYDFSPSFIFWESPAKLRQMQPSQGDRGHNLPATQLPPKHNSSAILNKSLSHELPGG